MYKTNHRIIIGDSTNISSIPEHSIDLIITSPPYPMIEMWDEIFGLQNHNITQAFIERNADLAFELMHKILDDVWKESFRLLKDGGIVCINIGDATRTINDNFQLFNNHSRINKSCLEIGFQNLPNIIWRKQTNAPNKFMGSGMLPPGAYITLEHEYILVFRKNHKREFKTVDKEIRNQSAYFWEERNIWFSDVWDFKGVVQKLNNSESRGRSAAYPFELPYRLINMFSVKGDTILDPFLGTGTTTLASIASGRNSIGIEIDKTFQEIILSSIKPTLPIIINKYLKDRLKSHLVFVDQRKRSKGEYAFKHTNTFYNFPVMTKQEKELRISLINSIRVEGTEIIAEHYEDSNVDVAIDQQLF